MTQLDHDHELRELLERTRSVAVIGVSADPERPSHRVAGYLIARTPWSVYLVNPVLAAETGRTVHGRPVYASLADLPEVPDLVDVFRRHQYLPAAAAAAIAAGAKALWFQLGLRHDQAAAIASDAGLAVVQDRCLRVEYARLGVTVERTP